MDVRIPRLPRELGYGLAIAVALVIGYASLIDPSGTPTDWALLGITLDKWLHGVAYAGLSCIIAYACLSECGPISGRAFLIASLLALGYGVVIEFYQAVLPYRTFSLVDLVANAVGSFLGPAPIAVIGRQWLQWPDVK